MEYVTDLVWKALAPVLPNRERLTMGHFLSVCGVVVAGLHPQSGDLYILVEPQAGGWGAGQTKDGESGLVCVGDGETYIVPVEIAETRYGFLVKQFAFQDDGAGAGEYRGGLGLVRDYQITGEEAYLTATFGRHRFSPWSMAGGQAGSTNRVLIIRADGTEELYGKLARCRLRKGEIARLITATGGGYGDPRRRPVERVVDDVRNGFIDPGTAARAYGVRVDPATLAVLELAPERLEQAR
jgi:N-methylhydantoinase B